MQDEEVPDVFDFPDCLLVESLGTHRRKPHIRKIADESLDAGLNEINTGGFQRLEKPAGKPDRYHVLVPGRPAPSCRELDAVERSERLALQSLEQAKPTRL